MTCFAPSADYVGVSRLAAVHSEREHERGKHRIAAVPAPRHEQRRSMDLVIYPRTARTSLTTSPGIDTDSARESADRSAGNRHTFPPPPGRHVEQYDVGALRPMTETGCDVVPADDLHGVSNRPRLRRKERVVDHHDARRGPIGPWVGHGYRVRHRVASVIASRPS
jgi:hypothetical protein